MWLIESNFQWSVQSNAELISFALLGVVIGPENSRHFSQPIRFKTKTKRDLATRVFPRFRQFTCFISSSRSPRYIFFPMISSCDCFGLVLRNSIEKRSIQILQRKLKPRLMSECFNLRQPVI